MSRPLSASGVCAPGELWLPGRTFSEYPTQTSEDLIPRWENYSGAPAVALKGLLGVFTRPDREITSIVSIDVCEVLRNSSDALHAATGISINNPEAFYQTGTWYDPSIVGKKRQKIFTNSVLQVLINNGLVQPVPYISTIRATVMNLRDNGAFVIANTATLPGCEPGTIDHTLQDTMLDCFDGIVFPRGYDSSANNGATIKAQALTIICAEADVDYENLPIFHIDDADGHHAKFREFFAGRTDITLLAPIAKSISAPEADKQFDTPVDAFLYAYALRNGRLAV